jgi:uncharacterized membrane protein
MLSTSALILFRLLHIVLGVFWAGTMVFLAAFFIPTMRAVPNAGAVMQHIMVARKLSAWLAVAAVTTVLSGITLYWNASLGFTSAWLHSGAGRTFGTGGVLAIIAFIIGMTVNNPGGRRLTALAVSIQAAGGAPTPAQATEIQALQKRMALSTMIIAVLVLLATAAMASARYVG